MSEILKVLMEAREKKFEYKTKEENDLDRRKEHIVRIEHQLIGLQKEIEAFDEAISTLKAAEKAKGTQ